MGKQGLLTSIEMLPTRMLSGPQFVAPMINRQVQFRRRPHVAVNIKHPTIRVPKHINCLIYGLYDNNVFRKLPFGKIFSYKKQNQ